MIFRQFCTADKEISYLLADPVTREAALLDPNVLAQNDYFDAIEQMDLTLVYAMETHVHESHQSLSTVLREQMGVQLIAHHQTQLPCIDQTVVDDSNIFIGEEQIRVIATPGHSECSICFYWHDRVFTGHTLLAGATGLCHRVDSKAEKLLHSVQQKLLSLPDDTLVYPGQLYANHCVSSIRQERLGNEEVSEKTTQQSFVESKKQQAKNRKDWQQEYLVANQRCKF